MENRFAGEANVAQLYVRDPKLTCGKGRDQNRRSGFLHIREVNLRSDAT